MHINRIPDSKGTDGAAVLGWVVWAGLFEEVLLDDENEDEALGQ